MPFIDGVNTADGGGLGTLFAPDNLAKIKALQVANAFSDGLPTDAAGNPDFGAMARTLIQKGDLANGVNLIQTGIQQQGLALAARNAAGVGTYPGATPAAPAAPGGPMTPFQNAISNVESGGKYDAVGPTTKTGDRAYGRYQVMGANIPQWTKDALGQEMTPEQFVASPQAQDAVFNHRFGGYLRQYGNPQDAASMWFTGRPYAQGAGASDQLGTTGSGYVSKFMAGLPRGGPQTAAASVVPAPAGGGLAPAAPPVPPAQTAQAGDAAASNQHPYAPAPPVLKPAPSVDAGMVPAAAAGQVAGPGAPSGAARGAPMPVHPTMPPALSPVAGSVPQPLDPSFGGQVPATWLQAGHTAGEWVNYARNQAAINAAIPGGFGKGSSEQWAKIADGLASSIDKSQTFTPEQKNARDPQAIAYEHQREDYKIAAQNSPEAIRGAGQKAAAEEQGRAEAASANTLVPYTQPDGTMRLMTKTQALDQASNGVGQGPMKSLPGYITTGQENLLAKVNAGTAAYQERQVAGERLDALSNLLSTYQTGANSQAFNDAVARVRSFGIPIANTDMINPAAMQQFTKNAYANVLSSMKEQGNKQYAAEVSSAVNSNPNTDLQPEANAAMIAQMKGIQQFHDANHRDFTNWYGKNQGASNDAQFQIGWAKDHPVQPFVDAARREIAPLGVALPAKNKLVDGQAYMVRGVKARWNAAAGGFVPMAGP